MKLFVKRICSLNPKKYKFVRLETAIGQYESYLTYFSRGWKKGDEPKTFENWLKTEI